MVFPFAWSTKKKNFSHIYVLQFPLVGRHNRNSFTKIAVQTVYAYVCVG